MDLDTAPIRPEERFDERRVADYLREHIPSLIGDGPIDFAQFPEGKANLTFLAKSDVGEVVLRRAPLGPVAKGGHDMEREYRVLSVLWQAFPKAPRAYHYCADPEVMGKPFFVMQRCHGYVIRNRWPPDFGDDHDVRRRLAGQLVTTLAALHEVDPEAVGLADFGRPDGFVARQIDGWADRWEAAKVRDLPEMAEARRLLIDRIPSPQRVTILHNDYKLDNTMASSAGDVVAVFDWDMATRGDPLVDVGTTLAYWADPDSPTYPIFGAQAVTLASYLSKEEILERYGAATGLDLSVIGYYEGLALYRITVIIEQIYARYVAGQTSDGRFAVLEPLTPILAKASLAVLEAA